MNGLQVMVSQEPGVIMFNFEELKEQLTQKMKQYDGALFSEEYKQAAKAEVANLRKLKEEVDKRRKEVDAQYMKPCKEFDAKVKELLTIIDGPICLIDRQLKEMEAERIRKRREDVKKLWDEIVGVIDGGEEFLPLEAVYDRRWDLAGTRLRNISDDLRALVEKTASEIAIITGSQSDAAEEALEIYKQGRDLGKALAHINTYEANKKKALGLEAERMRREEEYRRQQEIERVREEEHRRQAEITAAREEGKRLARSEAVLKGAPDEPRVPYTEGEDDLPFEQPSTVTAFYKVVATPEELEQIDIALNSLGIYFERRNA